jgi:hypothetical protein
MLITQANLAEIKEARDTHPNSILIREWHLWQEYEVGDVLIRQKRVGYGAKVKWIIDEVSAKCPVPRKFKIVHIDELMIPWVKQVSVRGGLGNKLIPLTDTTTSYRFELDPEMEVAVLLGVEYEPRAQYKNWRQNNPDYGG